jgi:hypothetical protein
VEIVDFLRIFNMFLAMATIPPSVLILAELIRDNEFCKDVNPLNKLLQLLFFFIATVGIVNAFLALMSLNDVEFYVTNRKYILNIRNMSSNIVLCFLSWGIFVFQRKDK